MTIRRSKLSLGETENVSPSPPKKCTPRIFYPYPLPRYLGDRNFFRVIGRFKARFFFTHKPLGAPSEEERVRNPVGSSLMIPGPDGGHVGTPPICGLKCFPKKRAITPQKTHQEHNPTSKPVRQKNCRPISQGNLRRLKSQAKGRNIGKCVENVWPLPS